MNIEGLKRVIPINEGDNHLKIENVERNKFNQEIFFKNLRRGSRFTLKDKYGNGYDSYTYAVTRNGEDFFVSELFIRESKDKDEAKSSAKIITLSIRRRKSPTSKSLEVWTRRISPYKDQNYETLKSPVNKGNELSGQEAEEFWQKYNDINATFEIEATEQAAEHQNEEIWKDHAKTRQQNYYDFIVENTIPKTESFDDLEFSAYTEVQEEVPEKI